MLERQVAAAQGQKLAPEVAARRALFACLALGDISVSRVARMMALHPRTLNRQLAARGTTLAALLKDVRYQMACELLAIDSLPITEIATTLRYADLASFTRAFRSWSGTSPLAWRKSRIRGNTER
jgi:AraC-like DNA-binding protein